MYKLTIQIWSDVVCPSCYIGMRQLKYAIQKLQVEDKVEIVLRSFQLDPNFPKGKSMSSLKHLAEVKGYGEFAVKQMCDRLDPVGKSLGINFQFEEILIYNTCDAHRLLHWAKTMEKSFELEEALFDAYFCRGNDLSVKKNILDLCQKIGLDSNSAKEVLESNDFSDKVIQDIELSKKIGVRGVPHFLIGNNTIFSGYRSEGELETIISNALNEVEKDEDTTDGNSCSIEGICD
tara:strand:+ start:10914 stop:11615 length:702 start_codon:yes stop_codon:yes gene_type:complete